MLPDIQSSSVEPIPEPEMMSRFEGKNVLEQVVRFFRTNQVKRFLLKRPFHKGPKDKENEYKVWGRDLGGSGRERRKGNLVICYCSISFSLPFLPPPPRPCTLSARYTP